MNAGFKNINFQNMWKIFVKTKIKSNKINDIKNERHKTHKTEREIEIWKVLNFDALFTHYFQINVLNQSAASI